jgi:hypothetical protein
MQPTRATGLEKPVFSYEKTRRPYLVLLPMGFALPSVLPRARCALTAPFHPDPMQAEASARRFVFCGTFPKVTLAGR